MENTRCGGKCAFVKAKFCSSDEECPNYVESFWEDKDGNVKCVKDCCPKRQLAETQRVCSRFLGIQTTIEQLRNRVDILQTSLSSLVEASRSVLIEYSQSKELENKND